MNPELRKLVLAVVNVGRRSFMRLLAAREQQLLELEEPPNVCPGCYAIRDEPCARYCIDRQMREREEEARELRELYPEDYQREDDDLYGDGGDDNENGCRECGAREDTECDLECPCRFQNYEDDSRGDNDA